MEDAHEVLKEDAVMADLIERHDPYSETEWSEFERLCISIINQQLSTASAAAVRARVFDSFEDEITPESVLDADEAVLRDAGLSRSKVEYLKNVARAFKEDDLTKEGLADHSDEEVVERLTEIKGVGEWTARMYLMFALEREDILPLGDLAVRNAIEELYGEGEMTREEMREVAEAWRPYRSVATRYIWAEYENG